MWQLIPIGVGAVMGARNAQKQADETKRQNLAQAEITRYSPWTGMHGQIQANTADPLNGAFQGAMGGLALGQGMSQAGMFGGGAGAASPAMAGQPGNPADDPFSTGFRRTYTA
jgi:hypothetical protein